MAGKEGNELLLLRAVTISGHPYGSPDFVEQVSTVIERPLQAKPRGCPRQRHPQEEEGK